MKLDYSDPERAVNFRDAGAFVNLIAGRELIPENRILRGGTIRYIEDIAVIGNPATILCLKNEKNSPRQGACMLHHPRPDTDNAYETWTPAVRNWLRAIVRSLVEPPIRLPLYVHCHSGRDRTGVVVAALLKILGVADDIIFEEYMLSEGAKPERIWKALGGLRDVKGCFPAGDQIVLRSIFLS